MIEPLPPPGEGEPLGWIEPWTWKDDVKFLLAMASAVAFPLLLALAVAWTGS